MSLTTRSVLLVLSLCLLAVPPMVAEDAPHKPPSMGDVLAASANSDWRALDPEETLYLDLPGGRVVISLSPLFAPKHVANIKTLVRDGYFDGLAVVRSQENYVVQWGDPAAEEEGRRPMKEAAASLPAEFDRPLAEDLEPTLLPDGDVYAPEVGFVDSMPVALDREAGRIWLAHCYAMVGAGRGMGVDSGSGAELYVVIGHSPRHLDLNVTLVGRVVQGMEALSNLPRGTGPLGFYESPEEYVEIESVRLAADVPVAERAPLEVLRTDTETFEKLIESRRFRYEEWFASPTGHVSLCNVPLPVRERPAG